MITKAALSKFLISIENDRLQVAPPALRFKTPIFLKNKKMKNNEINSDSVFGVATASGGFPWLSATNAEASNTD